MDGLRELTMEATAAIKHEMKIVPRRAKTALSGSVNQQPRRAQAKYGAPTTSPVRLSTSLVEKRPPLDFGRILNRWR